MILKKISNFKDYFWLNKLLLQICGSLPIPERGLFVNVFLTYFHLFCTGFLALPGMYIISFGNTVTDTSEKINIIAGETLELWVSAVKAITLIPHRSSMLSLYRQATSLSKEVKTKDDQEIMEIYIRRGLYLTYGLFCLAFLALLSVLIQPISQEFTYDSNGTLIDSKTLPYIWGITHENQVVYNFWWAIQCVASTMSLLNLIGVDTAPAAFTMYACAHLRLLQIRMRRIANWEDGKRSYVDDRNDLVVDEKEEKVQKTYREMVIECINTHQRIIRFCEDVEKIFRLSILVQMILSISAICGFCFNLLSQERSNTKFISHIIGATFQLLVYCLPPDYLHTESVNIGFATFNLRWYNWNQKDKSIVEFMIVRSQKPLILSAGKFTNITLETFSAVLSSAFSFFSILRRTI